MGSTLFVTRISGVELERILEETIVRLEREKDEAADSDLLAHLKSHVDRLQFFHSAVFEEVDYELTLDDWEFLNSGRGRWVLVP